MLVKLNGGLGNQMFQYALARIIAKRHNSNLLLDKELFKLTEKTPGHTPRNYELKIFGIEHPTASKEDIDYFERLPFYYKIKRELHLNYPKICFEKNFYFDSNLHNILPPVYLRGFFQSFKYFQENEDLIKEIYSFPVENLDRFNYQYLNSIRRSTSASVHIRRGDYIEDKITNKIHGTCNRQYYEQAISRISQISEEVNFFFFSDDIDWVEKEFSDFPGRKHFITSNSGKNSWKDMFLMSCCTHNIIANSSFSWWAAWLNRNKSKIVISPKKWFRSPDKEKYSFDLIPEEWIRI